MENKKQSGWKQRWYTIIYEADTPEGKLFDVVLLLAIMVSVLVVMLESVTGWEPWVYNVFLVIEWIITIFFTIEYILRIITVKKPWKYILSFYGIIDLISTLPQYLTLLVPGGQYLLTVRSLRLLRVFRVLKITRFIGEADNLTRALRNSRAKIFVFIFTVLVSTIIFGTLMYLVEGEESGFTSIPRSIYWCVVTLTTVGYGDIAPQTPLGQFIATIIMILGYGIIAVPTGIVSAEMTKKDDYIHVSTQVCQNCLTGEHPDDAVFCYSCGASLNVE